MSTNDIAMAVTQTGAMTAISVVSWEGGGVYDVKRAAELVAESSQINVSARDVDLTRTRHLSSLLHDSLPLTPSVEFRERVVT